MSSRVMEEKWMRKKKNCGTYSDHKDSLADVANAIIHQTGCVNELVLVERLWRIWTQGLHRRLHLLGEPWHDWRRVRWKVGRRMEKQKRKETQMKIHSINPERKGTEVKKAVQKKNSINIPWVKYGMCHINIWDKNWRHTEQYLE